MVVSFMCVITVTQHNAAAACLRCRAEPHRSHCAIIRSRRSPTLLLPERRTTTLQDLLGAHDVSKDVAKLEGRIFELYGANQVF